MGLTYFQNTVSCYEQKLDDTKNEWVGLEWKMNDNRIYKVTYITMVKNTQYAFCGIYKVQHYLESK